jgi:hypothetical protein
MSSGIRIQKITIGSQRSIIKNVISCMVMEKIVRCKNYLSKLQPNRAIYNLTNEIWTLIFVYYREFMIPRMDGYYLGIQRESETLTIIAFVDFMKQDIYDSVKDRVCELQEPYIQRAHSMWQTFTHSQTQNIGGVIGGSCHTLTEENERNFDLEMVCRYPNLTTDTTITSPYDEKLFTLRFGEDSGSSWSETWMCALSYCGNYVRANILIHDDFASTRQFLLEFVPWKNTNNHPYSSFVSVEKRMKKKL